MNIAEHSQRRSIPWSLDTFAFDTFGESVDSPVITAGQWHWFKVRHDFPNIIESSIRTALHALGTIQAHNIRSGRTIGIIESPTFTGADWQSLWRSLCGATLEATNPSASSIRNPGQLRTDRLAQIQSAFGFPLQTFAAVLRISRAQLYKWLDPEKGIQLQLESRSRLQQIERVASQWLVQSNAPLSLAAREPLPRGGDIIGMLSCAKFDAASIEEALRYLAAKTADLPESISERMRDRGFSRRPSFRSLPSDE